jgi:hypothetical protein
MTACVVVGLLVLVAIGAVFCLRRRPLDLGGDELAVLLLFLATLTDD